jgi:hypothetical protein
LENASPELQHARPSPVFFSIEKNPILQALFSRFDVKIPAS